MATKVVVFDFDGTITKPYLNFRNIREAMGIPQTEIYLLEKMSEMKTEQKEKAFKVLREYEAEAVENSELTDGVKELLDELKKRKIKSVILTRNSSLSINEACKKHNICFDLVVTREDAPVKPKPDGILLISQKMGIPLCDMMLVGDYIFDMMAGEAAGVKTVFLRNAKNKDLDVECDHKIDSFKELLNIIEK